MRTWRKRVMVFALIAVIVVLVAVLMLLGIRRAGFESQMGAIQTALHAPHDGAHFTAAMVADLPEPARRYFLHAIEEGTPIAKTVYLEGSAEMRMKDSFKPLTFQERILGLGGFVWTARMMGIVSAHDYYHENRGGVTIHMGYLYRMAEMKGPDIDRSSRHRLAIEHCWLPTALLPSDRVSWQAKSERQAIATLTIDDERIPITFSVAQDGRLERVEMRRWTSLDNNGAYGFKPYLGIVEAEEHFGPITIPSRILVGYREEEDSEDVKIVFRADVQQARFK